MEVFRISLFEGDLERGKPLFRRKMGRQRRLRRLRPRAWREGEKSYLSDEEQKESNERNSSFIQENIFLGPLRTWTNTKPIECFFTTDEAIIDSGIKERRFLNNGDFKIAACALKGLGYVQEERRINGRKARWWSKTTPNKEMSHVS